MTTEWPQGRNFPFAEVPGLTVLHNAWEYARCRIADVRLSVSSEPLPNEVACVAVSGSLSRMETHDGSDLDLLIVVDDRHSDISQQQAGRVYDDIWERLLQSDCRLEVRLPKSGGIFSQCVSWRALADPEVRGIVDEDVTSYGQRMQLLMDAQPVLNHDRFAELQRDMLDWYSEFRVARQFEEAGPFHWLWQDVRRYWHSLRSRACWLHAAEPAKSLEVNLKLRSSRLVLIAAFLHAIAATHQTGQEHAEMRECLLSEMQYTPLERLSRLAADSLDRSQLLFGYQHLWERIRVLSPNDAEPSADDRNAMSDLLRFVTQSAAGISAHWLV